MNDQNLRNNFLTVCALVVALLTINPPRVEAVGNHLDRTFATNGVAILDFSEGDDAGRDVAIQADGKIIIAGEHEDPVTSSQDFVVMRLKADGTYDETFNGTGLVITPVLGFGVVTAVAIQPDGKIVVAGSAAVNGIRQFCLVRYNTNGSLDTTFDGNGIVYTRIYPTDDNTHSKAENIAVQPDGKIVAVGYVSDGSNKDLAIVR